MISNFFTKMQGQPKTKTKGSKTLSTFPKHTKQFHSENQQCVKKKKKDENQNLITKQKINRRKFFFSFQNLNNANETVQKIKNSKLSESDLRQLPVASSRGTRFRNVRRGTRR